MKKGIGSGQPSANSFQQPPESGGGVPGLIVSAMSVQEDYDKWL